mmetsp:Transcript_61424/g.192549  ORF Transcript_61424/g.192549 Transcript_61424/m.192549 type:complete len:250 (+) Transcript_61424:656-1405(+)
MREGVHSVQHEGVLGLHELLHQDGHVQIVEAPAGLGQRDPGPQGEEGGPDSLDGGPGIAWVEQLLQPLLALLGALLGHGPLETALQILRHDHAHDELLSLLKDHLRVLIACGRLEPPQDLLELRQHRGCIRCVRQCLLHAAIGQRHRLGRQHSGGQSRVQQRQVQALGADPLARHLVRPDAPSATEVISEVHLDLLVGGGLHVGFRRVGVRFLRGRRPRGRLGGLDVEVAVGGATDLDPLAFEVLCQLG